MSITKCGYCGTVHDSVRDAMECCSEEFEDDDAGAAPALVADGGWRVR